MIIDNLLPNATDLTYYRPTTTQLTAKLTNLNLSEIPLQYAIGYANPSKIPYYHKLSKVTKSNGRYIVESFNKLENSDVLQIATVNNQSNLDIATIVNGKLTSVKYDNWQIPTPADIRFVNNVNISNTCNVNTSMYLVFYAVGYNKGFYSTAMYGRLDGFDNIDNFINGRTKLTDFIIAQQYSNTATHCHIPEIDISDFETGSHVYEFTENNRNCQLRVWIAGINYVQNYNPDTWQNKNWSDSRYTDKTCLKNAFVLTSENGKKYLSAVRPSNFPEYTSYYTDNVLPNYIDLDNIVNNVENNCIFADIDCELVDEHYFDLDFPYGNNWIFINNVHNYLYYCCNADEIKHQIAQTCRALVNSSFVYNNNPISYTVNNNFIYPEFNQNNEFTGNYIRPNTENDINTWQNTATLTDINKYDYNSKPQYRPDDISDFGDLTSNIGINTQTVNSGKLYKINTDDANTVLNFIGGTYSTDLILSPSDGLISFQYFPFEIPSYISNVPKIGAYNDNGTIKGFTMPTLANNYHFVNKTAFLIDLGKTKINAMYNDFRDFPPYTTYSAFIPFVNTSYSIDFAVFKNHEISFKLIVDVITGSGIVCIMRDGLLYDTVNGSVSTAINITSADMAQYNASIKATENAMQSNELNAKLAMVNMVNGLTASVATASTGSIGGITGAVSSVTGGLSAVANATLQRDMLEYQLSTTQVHHNTIQSASANCGNQLERNVHIIIAHAKMLPNYDSDIYADTVGYACCINDILYNCSHFTQVANIDMSGILCTDAEKVLIKTALTNGVVIK